MVMRFKLAFFCLVVKEIKRAVDNVVGLSKEALSMIITARLRNNIVIALGSIFIVSVMIWQISCLRTPSNSVPPIPPAMSAQKVKACSDNGNCSTDVILLSGQIYSGAASRTVTALNEALKDAGTNVICLDSIGGDNDAAQIIASHIANLGLSTCHSSVYKNTDGTDFSFNYRGCLSSCTWIMLAGKERAIYGSNVNIGFHGSSSYKPVGFCKCFRRPSEGAKKEWATLLGNLSGKLAESDVVLKAHLDLLDWSFEQGYGGETFPRELSLLLGVDHYFTSDRRSI